MYKCITQFQNHVISVQTCLSSVNNQILYFRFNSGQHLVTCGKWVLLCWVCMEIFCHFQFSGGSEGWALTQHWAGKVWFLNWSEMLKCLKHIFMTPYPYPSLRPYQPGGTDAVQHPLIFQHPPSYQTCQIVSQNLPSVNFLLNLHKFYNIQIFVTSQGEGLCKFKFSRAPRWRTLQNLIFVSPKVKAFWDFCFVGQGQKLAWRHPDLVSWIPDEPINSLH